MKPEDVFLAVFGWVMVSVIPVMAMSISFSESKWYSLLGDGQKVAVTAAVIVLWPVVLVGLVLYGLVTLWNVAFPAAHKPTLDELLEQADKAKKVVR